MPVEPLLSSAVSFAVATAVLGVALLVLHRRYRRRFMLLWAWGWISAGVASVGTSLTVVTASRGSGVAVTELAAFLLVAGTLVQGVAQWWGAREFRSALPPRRHMLPAALAFALVLAAAGVVLTLGLTSPVRLVVRVAIPYAILGAAFIYSAGVIRSRAEPRGVGYHVLPIVLGAYGLHKVLGAFVGGGIVDLPGDTLFLFTDLLFLSFVAFALPAWFLEEEWARTNRSQLRQRELEQGLYEAQKLTALGEMAAGIAHDFNNILTVIGGHAELLREEGQRVGSDSLTEIVGAQGRGSGLVRRLMAFARHQELKSERIDPRQVLDDVTGLLRPLVGDAVLVEARHGEGPFPVDVDRMQLEQALVNLGANGRDAMPEGGRLLLEVGRREAEEPFEVGGVPVPAGRWTYFRVVDSGIGMSEEVQARAFEPFFTTKTRERGTGLGLSTAFGFVQQSDGYITVESEVGRGSAFTIFLPAAE